MTLNEDIVATVMLRLTLKRLTFLESQYLILTFEFLIYTNTFTSFCLFSLNSDGQYIVAGSDDGSFFIWNRQTTNIVQILAGDSQIVNCLQPHPTHCLLATSGIDPLVRLWSPKPEVNIDIYFCTK